MAPGIILPKLLPLLLDGSAAVRTQLVKLLRLLSRKDVTDRVESTLLYIRAGMTHLAVDIRNDAVNTLEWLLENAREDTVTCPGGWVKTLNAFMSMMGWAVSSGSTKWSSSTKVSFGKGGRAFPKHLITLAQFLRVGLGEDDKDLETERSITFPVWDVGVHAIPVSSNSYSYLNIFGPGRDEEGEMYTERESRQRVFKERFHETIERGIESAKKEGGEVGRAAAILGKAVADGMNGFSCIDKRLIY